MLAARQEIPILLVECRCDDAEIRKRLEERVRRDLGPSDADWTVYVEQRRRSEPFSATERDHLVIETTQSLDSQTRAVERALLDRRVPA
jgi:predicted kinase